jgi:hypothetical protein
MRGRLTPPRLIKQIKADVSFTISIGVNPSSGLPPMVPRNPEIDLINGIILKFYAKL